MKILVLCSADNYTEPAFFKEVELVVSLFSRFQHDVIIEGPPQGTLNILAKKIKDKNITLTSILTESAHSKGLAFPEADNTIIAHNQAERKMFYYNLPEAFMALPGPGILENVLDLIIQKRLRVHDKPVVLVNTDGYFNSIISFYNQHFTLENNTPSHNPVFSYAESSREALSFIYNKGSLD